MRVYENQRWWLGNGWGSRLLPYERTRFSSEDGKDRFVDMASFDLILPAGWIWEQKWRVQATPGRTNRDGWEYGDNCWQTWGPSDRHFTRRRLWVRKMAQLRECDHLDYSDSD